MINLFSKTNDFIKSEKLQVFPLVCSKYLSSWTGLGDPDMTEVRVLVHFGTFRVQKWYSDEIIHDFASFLPEKLKNQVILTPNLNI